MRTAARLAAPLLLLCGTSAYAQEASRQQIDTLARDVTRVESLRAVKDLQRFYAQYAQFGLADEMADLFAEDATLTWGDKTVSGKKAIAAWLKQRLGSVRGLAPGAVRSEFIEDPLVNLSVDGRSAKGRWMGLTFAGDGKGKSLIEGGIFENEFVFDGGKWKFSKLHFFPQYEGDYEHGWYNAGGGDLPLIPFHFTLDETGIPIPPAEGAPPPSEATLPALETRVAALNAEDTVRNLQNAYGYYVDRKMWDDVVDLFTDDGLVEIAGVGTFKGKDGVRKAMELMGAQGLKEGQMNDHPSFDTLVTVAPGNREAFTRGQVLGMTGETSTGEATWEFDVFRNRMVLDDGIWKIREMHIFPLLKADYKVGWGSGGVVHLDHVLPAFTEPHPVTGKPVTIAGFTTAAEQPSTGPVRIPQAVEPPPPTASGEERLITATRRLARSSAYDGVVNVSAAYGYYLDDFQWPELGGIFAKNGNKHSPFAGFYLGQDRIKAAATAMYGKAPPTRPGISFHWRFQPVILVSEDGRSANLRTRLFQPRTTKPKNTNDGSTAGNILAGGAGLFSAMYPNDQAVLENGIWRLWSLTIDEPYITMAGWKGGWSAVKPSQTAGSGHSPLVERLPPDILMTKLGKRAEHFRGGTGEPWAWPQILPMWFNYKNLVSGRVPEFYWPDSVPSLLLPQSRLIANGYQQPPSGPEQDGIHIELTPPENNVMDSEKK